MLAQLPKNTGGRAIFLRATLPPAQSPFADKVNTITGTPAYVPSPAALPEPGLCGNAAGAAASRALERHIRNDAPGNGKSRVRASLSVLGDLAHTRR
jgi:hypothetical protein